MRQHRIKGGGGLDLRGRAASEAPHEVSASTDSRIWADDIKAILTDLELKSSVLVGWSYGAPVISCYLAPNGDEEIAGIALIGGIIAIGAYRKVWMARAGRPALNRDLCTNDQPRLIASVAEAVHKAFANSELQLCEQTARAPFAEHPKRFNSALASFAQEAA